MDLPRSEFLAYSLAKRGLSVRDIIALSSAHTLGQTTIHLLLGPRTPFL
jgi:hypothetical protein